MAAIQQLLLSYSAAVAAVFPLSGLVSYWKADESTGNLVDLLGGNKGIGTSATSVAGKINNGISFSGGTSFVALEKYLGTIWDNPYTLSMWVKPTALDTTNGDILLWPGDRNQQHIIGSDGKLCLTTYDGTANNVIGNTVLTNGNWYHVVFQRTSGTVGKIYLNGADDTSGTAAMRNPASTIAHTFRLGSRQDFTAGNFNGLEDEISIWNRVLSGAEILALYNGGSGLQPSISLAYMYAYGGYSGANETTNYQFSVSGNSWATRTAMTAGKRSMGCYALSANTIYAAGGTPGGSATNTNYQYSQSGDSWATKAVITVAKYNMTSASVGDGNGYCIAGCDTAVANQTTNYQYSESGDSWATKTASTQAARGLGAGTNILTDKIYQSCGYVSAPSAIHLEFSVSGNSWATKTSRSDSRYDGCFSTISGSNYAYFNSGWTGAALSTVNAQYSQSGNSWASKTACTASLYEPASTVISTDLVCVTGGDNGSTTYYSGNYHYSEAGNSWATKTAMTTTKSNFQGATL